MLFLVLWYAAYTAYPQFAPIYIFISGPAIGLTVRIHGKGYKRIFATLAILAHLWLVLAAYLCGLILGKGETIWAIILLGLYVAGAWTAGFIGRIKIPFIEQRSFYKLAEMNQHASDLLTRNDVYAKIFIASDFACRGNKAKANDLLTRLLSVTRDNTAKSKIDNMIYNDYRYECDEEYRFEFSRDYLLF